MSKNQKNEAEEKTGEIQEPKPEVDYFFSPKIDRKIAFAASIIFMSAAWVVFAGLLALVLIFKRSVGGHWNALEIVVIGIFLVILVLIPIQLTRYFRQK